MQEASCERRGAERGRLISSRRNRLSSASLQEGVKEPVTLCPLENLNTPENMPVAGHNAARQQFNTTPLAVALMPGGFFFNLLGVAAAAHAGGIQSPAAIALTSRQKKKKRVTNQVNGLSQTYQPVVTFPPNLPAFPMSPQRHARARRASFAVTTCAAFLTAGSATMTTTARTTRMKGTAVSGLCFCWPPARE